MKIDVLVFGAHPDDAELGCGGTVIKLVEEGKKVGVIDLTNGELGTRGTAKTRKQECKNATEILGVAMRENMNFKDGFFENSEMNKLALIEKIRAYQPEIVITNSPTDRHPDHGRGCYLVVDACFLSGLEKIDTRQKVWRPQAIYHYIQFNHLQPDFVIDISEQMKKKLQSVKAYKTQFYDKRSKETETIISKIGFLESVKYRAQDLGRQSNCQYAEGFITNQLLKVDSFFDIK
ncbi:MAG: bacillithiol biosynthesis deacetylase BshB1 [Bacteroidota bacterium]|nr:bacillithiol biosynthesis deacetylase BshB1 [Bacteroidota bacterium]